MKATTLTGTGTRNLLYLVYVSVLTSHCTLLRDTILKTFSTVLFFSCQFTSNRHPSRPTVCVNQSRPCGTTAIILN